MDNNIESTEGESASPEEMPGVESVRPESASFISGNDSGTQREAALKPLAPDDPTPAGNPKLSVNA